VVLRVRGQRLRTALARDRQAEHKGGAAFGIILTGNLSPMILHDTVGGAQSQASAFADRLGGVERIEDAMRLFDARAAIGKMNHHVCSLRVGADPKQSSAGFLQGIQGIFDDLNEYLEQLMAVPPHSWQVRFERSLDTYFLIVPLQFLHMHAPLQKRGQIHHHLLAGALLREAEKIRDQISSPLGMVDDLADQRILLTGQTLIRPEFLGVSHDRVQGMIDLMRSPGDQLTERGQLFSLYQMALNRCSFSKLRRESSSRWMRAWS